MTETSRFLVVMLHVMASAVADQQKSLRRSAEDARAPAGGRTQPGLCGVAPTASCCSGWKSVNGVCQPTCGSCVNGKCVGPDQCLCSRGYEGARCANDVNECGLPARPCSQRCMNTHGSYRCYCEAGFALGADGHTCTREATCFSLRCQFGCQTARGGALSCLCPPGLRLAADNKTCEDVDECERDGGACPPPRACRNTFGGFACVCGGGFVAGTLRGAVRCRDEDECLSGSHRCSRHARCLNTGGSYTCRCSEGYHGNGRACRPRRAPQSKAAMYYRYKLSRRTKRRHLSP
ncbi:nephronectin isoform X1 [Betta splendens]|uniref:Nephronectin isoform X1 n=1 Tax=Betta splendens TaxID=158456 RepID=A0A6P7NIV9_BETSP|nr:nephronectin isoform X1 [Betta splendens]